ncbi:MAG: hypothetical protein K6T78_03670 [Alicyclobacillus sp.]|nr:hypothetical protein [Alicyclobacillus sp.]
MSHVNPLNAKTELVQAAKVLASSGMLFRGEHANLSARLGEDKVDGSGFASSFASLT